MKPLIVPRTNDVMEGEFCVKDNTSLKSEKKVRKCRVHLQANTNGQVMLQIGSIKSSVEQEVENLVFVSEQWLVCFAETKGQSASLALVKASTLKEYLVIEAKYENMAVLKMMEVKLRESLRVISYDIIIQETVPNGDPLEGVIHIFPDKVLVTQGFPPDLRNILSHSIQPKDNGIILVGTNGLCCATKPDLVMLSEHRDNIWKTFQGCIEKVTCTTATTTETTTTTNSELPGLKCPSNDVENDDQEPHYYNLPRRPTRYIYMNVPDKCRAPYGNHNYVNVFNVAGTIYQNWQNCVGTKIENDGEEPPPCPPRRPVPPLPPKPRNRPPDSPLPPIPTVHHGYAPPPLPPSRLKQQVVPKELQYVVYSSKPVVGQFWVIQVIFFQKNDDSTLERIKKLEKESNYQLLKPLPETIKVAGDFKISFLEMESGWALKSERHQVVEFQVVKEAVLPSCWMVIEFHLEHIEKMKHNFHAKVVINAVASRNACMANKDVLISATFQNPIEDRVSLSVCNPLQSIGVRKYLELCTLLDVPCALRNDWTGLAGEVGLTIEEVFKIQSKAYCFHNYSPTNEVLNIWSQKEDRTCGVDKFSSIMKELQRFDVLSVLDDPKS